MGERDATPSLRFLSPTCGSSTSSAVCTALRHEEIPIPVISERPVPDLKPFHVPRHYIHHLPKRGLAVEFAVYRGHSSFSCFLLFAHAQHSCTSALIRFSVLAIPLCSFLCLFLLRTRSCCRFHLIIIAVVDVVVHDFAWILSIPQKKKYVRPQTHTHEHVHHTYVHTYAHTTIFTVIHVENFVSVTVLLLPVTLSHAKSFLLRGSAACLSPILCHLYCRR